MLPEKASLTATYGGPYANSKDVDDPTTQIDQSQGNQFLCDVAMMTHTPTQAWVVFTGVTYTSGTMTIVPDDHDALWGSGTDVRPTVEQTAAGIYRVTWPANVDDELGDSHPVNMRAPDCSVYDVSTKDARVIGAWTANVVTINTYSAGVLNALNASKIKVWSQ